MFNLTDNQANQIIEAGIFSFGKFGIIPNFMCLFITGSIAFGVIIVIEMGAIVTLRKGLKWMKLVCFPSMLNWCKLKRQPARKSTADVIKPTKKAVKRPLKKKQPVKKYKRRLNFNVDVDDDVLFEKDRIDHMTPDELKSQRMVMQNVSKSYGSFEAVKDFSFALQKYAD